MSKKKKVVETPLAEVFRFCPRCGQAAESVGGNPFHCSACGYSHYFTPVAAVAGIIADQQQQVLFIRRQKDPGKGKLCAPGGFVDPGEGAEEALIREIREEVNLQAEQLQYLASFPNRYVYRGVATWVTDVFYTCQVESFEDIAAQEGEVEEWLFLRPTRRELRRMAFESHRQALEIYLQQRTA